ncbi:AraC family transcriptional regulator [Chitinophaga nivalis]|uniref:Helix-turn-helix domain-containing protein n=1 Tax=Chitinophaga nivalis TaxID=2991709 RepID=A0ABT3IJH7_9BACT|nr:helix-turn-helix domain-containing protein [Chitinophaga nivalis]MCW3466215.1 helix-turn-helix domain-containing protein [Chitinophaga nivalis]MCW3484094.1 helix-turn-helix domain-containing protein [Chitinophaga nivalis]
MAILLAAGNYFGTERKADENSCFKLNITHYQPYTEIHEHYHENAYLSLLISGHYQEVHKHTDHILSPGEIIFRPAGYNHANHFQHTGGSCLNIEFKEEILQQQALKSLVPGSTTIYQAGTFEYLYKLLYCFINNIDSGLSEEYLFRWMATHDPHQSHLPVRLPWLSKAIRILENEPEERHSITSLAARVYVHPVYLARAFKERTGLTPGEYQLKIRIQKAMALLFRTRLSVNEIACSTGFTDAAHFIRSFRLFYPATPHRFRSALKS